MKNRAGYSLSKLKNIDIDYYWLDYEGNEVYYGSVNASKKTV